MNSRMLSRRLSAAAILVVAACSDDPIAPREPSPTGQITVDANSWAYVRFENETAVLAQNVTSAQSSTDWHMAFFGTSVMLNGGAAGPGNVSGYCICANATATNTEIMAMTPQSELADFEAIDISDYNTNASSLQSDVLVPVVANWHSGTGATAAARPDSSWVISRNPVATRIYSKFRVVSLSGATATSPGTVNFEYATQASTGAAFGAVQSRSVAVGSTPVYFSFATGAVVASTADWDIQFDGFDIRLNSGVSGSGTVKGLSGGNQFSTLTASDISFIPPQAWKSDTYGGVFTSKPWYKYNITGTDNQIWPTFNVYVIAVGNAAYKVQLTSYYSTAGASRHVTMRYSRIR